MMGQLLRIMTSDHSTEDSVPALRLGTTPLVWYHLDDGVMGGKSVTSTLSCTPDGALHFAGTIDTQASVGWASIRSSLPPEGLQLDTTALKLQVKGDGKTYKVLLMDANHDSHFKRTPLWEADLPTKADVSEEVTIPLSSFIPSFMGRQLSTREKQQFPIVPTNMTKIGFMLSSRLSNGTTNPSNTFGHGTFVFSLYVESLEVCHGKDTI